MSHYHEALRDIHEELKQKDPLLRWGAKFVHLEECSPNYQQSFKTAWKAIEHGSLRKLRDSIENMKKYANTCPGDKEYLDVCSLQCELSLTKRKRTFYYMGLLAHAAICGQKNMVEELIRSKASPKMGNSLSGIPLTQMLVYALHHSCCSEVIDDQIIQLLTGTDQSDLDTVQKSHLDINILYLICDDGSTGWCSPIELAISIKRIDIAKQLVIAGANPIHPSLDRASGVLQLLNEYYEFGTNEYIFWLLHQYLLSDEITPFIERVMNLDIFNESGMRMFDTVGRHPAHALLTCGNEEMVRRLLEKHPEIKVNIKDGSERTALQIATENGDLDSVRILLKIYSEEDDGNDLLKQLRRTIEDGPLDEGNRESNHSEGSDRSSDHIQAVTLNDDGDNKGDRKSGISQEMAALGLEPRESDDEDSDSTGINDDMALALLVAARKDDIKIARCILEENVFIAFDIVDQAVEEGLTTLFEVLRDYPIIYNVFTGNNLVHTAALTGNAKLFKMFFPLQPSQMAVDRRLSHHAAKAPRLQKIISANNARKMFEALTFKDNEKTPLHLAINNNHICILRTLQERIVERDSHPGAEQSTEKNAWDEFWREWGPKLFVYACSHGSVEAAKFIMELEIMNRGNDGGKLLKEAEDDNGDTPLSAAARSGNDDILLYLLDDLKIQIPNSSEVQDSPLLLAAGNGHAACVSILLKKGADITVKNDYGYNCLMIATERKYSRTVMVILSDKRGFEALRCRKGSVTPMRMLIEHLPDVAEWILNRCVLEKHKVKSSDDPGSEAVDGGHANTSEGNGLDSEFEFLEDFRCPGIRKNYDDVDFGDSEDGSTNEDWQPQNYHSANHTIKLMVKYDREKLLNHVLVKTLINYKWWRVLPILVFFYAFHLLYLVLLTAFTWVLPIAGPACISGVMGLTNNTTDSITDRTSCEDAGRTQSQMRFLISSAVIVLIDCSFYLLLEINQLYHRGLKKYFTDPQNYFQVITYVFVIIFVFPLGHECWCYPSWRWQIGALAIFLAWINNFLLLKHIPYIGKPVTMLFNVYLNFILLIYLPILLILTFAFPFYMLFIASLEGDSAMALVHFPTPFHAMWSVILQTADGPDAEFFSQQLSHQIMTYALFITFIIAGPILFNNFLVGIAVGETEAERRRATFSIIKSKVDFIFESEDSIPFFRRCCYVFKPKFTITNHKIELLQQQNRSVLEELKLKGDVHKNFKKLDKLQSEMAGATRSLGVLEGEIKQVFTVVQELRDSITKTPEKSFA